MAAENDVARDPDWGCPNECHCDTVESLASAKKRSFPPCRETRERCMYSPPHGGRSSSHLVSLCCIWGVMSVSLLRSFGFCIVVGVALASTGCTEVRGRQKIQ